MFYCTAVHALFSLLLLISSAVSGIVAGGLINIIIWGGWAWPRVSAWSILYVYFVIADHMLAFMPI